MTREKLCNDPRIFNCFLRTVFFFPFNFHSYTPARQDKKKFNVISLRCICLFFVFSHGIFLSGVGSETRDRAIDSTPRYTIVSSTPACVHYSTAIPAQHLPHQYMLIIGTFGVWYWQHVTKTRFSLDKAHIHSLPGAEVRPD